MIKILYIYLLLILFTSCSINQNSKFWTKTEKIEEENQSNVKKLLVKEKALNKEFNQDLKLNIKFDDNINKNFNNYNKNDFNANLSNTSKFKFSKIENFEKIEPEIILYDDFLVFFDGNGSILKFDTKSNLIWKKNYYLKSEKKLRPLLEFANSDNFLVVADNISKIYKIDLDSGELIWSKRNVAPFNSEIKIFKDKIFVIDYSNTLRSYSLKDGNQIWSVNTQNSLIRSKKKLSLIIIDEKVIFNNSIGDITAVDINNGQLLWQLPTQNSLNNESAFSLKNSNIVTDGKDLIFSNNKNQIFSIDIKSGSFNWETKVNSFIASAILDNLIFTISLEGYLVVIEKNSGNIIRITDIFNKFENNERSNIFPTGFSLGFNKIYLSTSNGRLLIIDLSSGKTISLFKIDNQTISKPFILNNSMFIAKNNAVIKID